MPKRKPLNATKIEDIKLVYRFLCRQKKQKANARKTDYEIKRNTVHALNVSTCVVHKALDKNIDGDEKLPEKNTHKEKNRSYREK